MQELRLVAVSEDGSYAVLVVPGRSGRFALPIDERLRTVARGQFSRLAQYEIEVESPLRPKEIQDRIRAGETAEEIADAAGLPVDRIRRFEGPVLAEREFRAGEAQRATVRGPGELGAGLRLGEVVTERLAELGATPEDADWDSRKRQDGTWQVQLAYTIGGRMHVAEWIYDPRSKHVTPDDDEAIRLCLHESQWPGPRQSPPQAMTATVTPIGSRAAAVAHPAAVAHQPAAHQPAVTHPAEYRDGDRGRGLLHPARHAQPAVQVSQQTAPPVNPAAELGPFAPSQEDAYHGAQAQAEADAAGMAEVDDPAPGTDRAPVTVPPAAERVRPQEEAQAEAPPATPAPTQDQPTQDQPTGEARADDRATEDRATDDGTAGESQAGEATEQGNAPAPQPRPGKRSGGSRSRRSSVPSWDEIMFGNSRQPD